MTEDPWLVFTAIATGSSALATLVSAIFIAVQAWFTRKSVQETASALSLTQREIDQNARVFVDAQKARIDAEMPRLSIDVFGVRIETSGSSPTVLEAGTQYDRDDATPGKIIMVISLSVSNDGPRVAHIITVASEGKPSVDRISVSTGAHVDFAIRVSRTFQQWVTLADDLGGFESTGGDAAVPIDLVELVYKFPGDTGADEHQLIAMRGSVLRTINQIDYLVAAPSLSLSADFEILVQPFTRDYWQSRTQGRALA